MNEGWFSALGEALDDEERAEIAGYLVGLGFDTGLPVRAAKTWSEAGELCRTESDRWWQAEEAERVKLERNAHLDPAQPEWLALSEALHGAAAVAAARAGRRRPIRPSVLAQVRPILRRTLAARDLQPLLCDSLDDEDLPLR